MAVSQLAFLKKRGRSKQAAALISNGPNGRFFCLIFYAIFIVVSLQIPLIWHPMSSFIRHHTSSFVSHLTSSFIITSISKFEIQLDIVKCSLDLILNQSLRVHDMQLRRSVPLLLSYLLIVSRTYKI